MSDAAGSSLPDPDFPRSGFGRTGYGTAEVDQFVEQVQRALLHDPPAMAPYEVADQEFHVVRLRRGYAMRPVDEYLTRAQEVLRGRHGDEASAALDGRRPKHHHHFPTWTIYLVAVIIAVLIVTVALTNF